MKFYSLFDNMVQGLYATTFIEAGTILFTERDVSLV